MENSSQKDSPFKPNQTDNNNTNIRQESSYINLHMFQVSHISHIFTYIYIFRN